MSDAERIAMLEALLRRARGYVAALHDRTARIVRRNEGDAADLEAVAHARALIDEINAAISPKPSSLPLG